VILQGGAAATKRLAQGAPLVQWGGPPARLRQGERASAAKIRDSSYGGITSSWP
jgi:hypothetical protein